MMSPRELSYDFVVCGAGSSGSVVAGRLAEITGVTVLLIEAGGSDDIPPVMNPGEFRSNLHSARDWRFRSEPNPQLNGRILDLSMGKVLGGGSSINVLVWARGHKNDWDFFASESGNAAWSYDSVLKVYQRAEDWQGAPDPERRGTGGPAFVQPAPSPSGLAIATVESASSLGFTAFNSPNGCMMEGVGGAAIADLRLREDRRESSFRSYAHPLLDQGNLTVLTHAVVSRVLFHGSRATGVEFVASDASVHRVAATAEVILSLGAFNTPKVLMHSGIGDSAELQSLGINVVQHLPGVGRNLQDHIGFSCVWEHRAPLFPRNNGSEAVIYWADSEYLDHPDMFACQAEFVLASEENVSRYGSPAAGWTLFGAPARPASRGSVRLASADPTKPIRIEVNALIDPADREAAKSCIAQMREVGNAAPLGDYVKREVMPGKLSGSELDAYVRDAATTYWHQVGTAKMGTDSMAVVDGKLRTYGVANLRIADASIMPRITTGNTMAPCVVIGEQAAEFVKDEYQL